MAELTLSFTPEPSAELIETSFLHWQARAEVRARLGSYGRSFKWTAAVQALAYHLLHCAACGRRGGNGNGTLPVLEGQRPSLAASLNDALTARPRWVTDMFGEANGRPVLLRLINRWNADFNTAPRAPVRLWLEADELPPQHIRVSVGGELIEDPARLERLAEDIRRQWAKSKPCTTGDGEALFPPAEHSAKATVRIETVDVEVTLTLEYDEFGREQQEEFLDRLKRAIGAVRRLSVKRKRRGSVILTLELTRDEAEKLVGMARAGKLSYLNVSTAEVVGPAAEVEGLPGVTSGASTRSGWQSEDRDGSETSAALIRGLRAWEPDAWERLVSLYGPLIYRWCRRAGLQPADSRDVGQEVFRAVMRGISQFHRDREGDTFRGWLWAITRNKIIACRRGRPPALTGTSALEASSGSDGDASDPAERALEARIVYWRALAVIRGTVEERTWQAFWSVTVEGRAAADVAAELGMSSSGVYRAKSHVLGRLRNAFADVPDPDRPESDT